MQRAIQNQDRVALRIAQDKYAELVRKSEEVLVSYSADVTGKGLLGVPKPPAGAAPIPPVSPNGDPREPDRPPQPDAKKDGDPQQPGGGTGAAQQRAGTPATAAQPMLAQQSAAGTPAAGGAPAGGGAPSGGGAP